MFFSKFLQFLCFFYNKFIFKFHQITLFLVSRFTSNNHSKMFSTHVQSSHWDNHVDAQHLDPNEKFINVSALIEIILDVE